MNLKITQRKPDSIHPYECNPRVNDHAVDAVAKSIAEFGFRQPIVIDPDGVIICGHTRHKAALQLGLETVPVHEVDLPPEKVRALRIADNQTNTLADWDRDLLGAELAALKDLDFDLHLLGFPEEDLESLLAALDEDGAGVGAPPPAPTSMAEIQEEAYSIIEGSDRVLVQFSGGKDSTVVLNWVRGVCDRLQKPLEAVFVETGAEFPDLTSYIIRICAQLRVKLVMLHPKQNILQYYCGKGQWPDPLYRDCLHKFINEPVNNRIRNYEGENVICVRGGRSDQKTALSKSGLYQEVKDGKHVVRLLNPFFGVSKEEYERALEAVEPLLWPGYKHGFCRTACWCCPFQKHEQWDALRVLYPLLWEEMRTLSKTLTYKHYKGDRTRTRYQEYWQSHGTDIPVVDAEDVPEGETLPVETDEKKDGAETR